MKIENCIGGIGQGNKVQMKFCQIGFMIREESVMENNIFNMKVKEVAEKKPKLFAIDSDDIACVEKIAVVENYYNIKLPCSYKEFVQQYGGGYFGFIIVFSCDCNGMFYIIDKISVEWVKKKSFLPVIDLETGDYIGFKIIDGICQSVVSLYSHEEDSFQDIGMDFYEILIKYGLKST